MLNLRLPIILLAMIAGSVDRTCVAQILPKEEVLGGEAKFLGSRLAIKEIHCSLRVKSKSYGANRQLPSFTCELWASEDKLRMDTIRKVRSIPNIDGQGIKGEWDEDGLPQREVVCKGCERAGQIFQGDDNSNHMKFLGPPGWKNDPAKRLVHPRIIGCFPGSFSILYGADLNMMLQANDRADLKVDSELLDGVQTVKLQWINSYTARITLWLDPKRGYFPVQVEARATRNVADIAKASYSIWRNLEIVAAKGDGTFFPKRIKFKQYLPDNVLSMEEEITIDEIEIGKKIDPSIFTISGFKLGDDFYIQDPKEVKLWKAEKISPVPPERMEPVTVDSGGLSLPLIDAPIPANPAPDRSWMYWLAVALIAVAGIWFVARLVAQRRASA